MPSTTAITGEESPYYLYQQDPGQDHHPANSRHSGPTTEKRAGRVLEKKGMHRSDLNPA